MSDTCNKNKTMSSEPVELGIAIHKVLTEEWRFAKHVETGAVIGLNRSFMDARGADSSEHPDNILAMANDVVEGPLFCNFKFYSEGYSDKEMGRIYTSAGSCTCEDVTFWPWQIKK